MNQINTENQTISPTATKTFVALIIAHALGDLLGGSWPIFKNIAGLDLGTAGVISAVATSSMMALQPLCGFYADRGHRRLLMVLGTGLTMLTAAFGPIIIYWQQLGDTLMYSLLFILLLLIRLGQAMYHPPGTSIAGNISSKKRSTLVAVFITCGMFGYAVNWQVFSWVWQTFNRHTEWMLLPSIPLMIFIWLWCRPVEAHQERHVRMRDVIWQLTHARRPILLLYMIQVMMTALMVGLQFLLPEFCQQNNYPEFIQNGGSLFLLIAGSIIMMVPVGHVADRFGRKRTLNIMLALTLVCYTTMVMIPDLPLWEFCVLCVLIGGFSMAGGPIAIAMAQQLAPKSESMISGVVMGLAWALGSVSTAIVGVLAEQKGIGILGALQWMILAGVIALPLGWMLPKMSVSHD